MSKRKINLLIVIGVLLATVLIRVVIPSKSLLTRGIVVGMGIDKTDEGYEVTLQMVVAGNSAQPGSASSYSVVTGSGSTAVKASVEAERMSSFAPAYALCHIIILGEELAKSDFALVTKLLYRHDIVMDDTIIAASEGTAKDVLKAKVPVSGASSLYLQQEIKTNHTEKGRLSNNLRTFVCNCETPGCGNYLNWIKKKEIEEIPSSQSGTSNSQSGTSAGQSSGSGGDGSYIFDCSGVLLYGEQGQTLIGDQPMARGMALVVSGTGMMLHVYTNEGFMDVLIERVYRYWKIYKNGRVRLNSYYYVKIVNQNIAETEDELTTDYIKGAVKEEIRSAIKHTYELAAEHGVDVFCLKSKCIKKYGKKMLEVEPVFDLALAVFVSD